MEEGFNLSGRLAGDKVRDLCWLWRWKMLDLKFTDVVLVFATLAGPIFAVQAQKWIERSRETRGRRLAIFHTLMATRATRLAADHVQALNRIELDFLGGWQAKKWAAVVAAYRVYFDRLCQDLGENPDPAAIRQWHERCDDLFIDMMFEMSKSLGFSFDKVQLRRGVYYPKLFNQNEMTEKLMRDSLLRVLSGHQPLAMRVTDFPFSEEAAALQMALQKELNEVVSGNRPLRVRLNESEAGDRPKVPEAGDR